MLDLFHISLHRNLKFHIVYRGLVQQIAKKWVAENKQRGFQRFLQLKSEKGVMHFYLAPLAITAYLYLLLHLQLRAF